MATGRPLAERRTWEAARIAACVSPSPREGSFVPIRSLVAVDFGAEKVDLTEAAEAVVIQRKIDL